MYDVVDSLESVIIWLIHLFNNYLIILVHQLKLKLVVKVTFVIFFKFFKAYIFQLIYILFQYYFN